MIVDEIAVPQSCPFMGGTGTATLSGWRQTSDTGTPDVKEAEDFGDRPVDRTAKAVGSRKLSLRSEKLGPSWLKVVTVQVIEAAAQRLAIERGGALPGHPDARRPV